MILWNVVDYAEIDEWYPTRKEAEARWREVIDEGNSSIVDLKRCVIPHPVTSALICKIIKGSEFLESQATIRTWES